ncbi:hypothetical protein NVP1121O_042 [Vibrio phage 1.121.O._10N.286.46.C4]|nr:hypothetical protein NVP1121O_042 [Vibrio phage 1.121.O._10N.286.46.C4]
MFSKKAGSSTKIPVECSGKLIAYSIKLNNPVMKKLAKDLLSEITFYKKTDRNLYTKHMEVVLTNLLRCSGKQPLLYSRDVTAGNTSIKRYNPQQIKVRTLIKVIDILEDAGLLTNKVGKASKKKEFRVPSYIQPTDLFLDTFSDIDSLSESVEEKLLDKEETIILRDEYKMLAEYRDSYYTRMARAVVVGLNSINRQFEFKTGEGELITNHYCRIYNETFDKGGRFYRAGILQLKNKGTHDRLKVTCNNEPMVEVDYCNLHILLLTIMEGFQYDPSVDLYNKCIPEGLVTPNTRSLVKTATNIMLNAKKESSARNAIQQVLDGFDKDDLPDQVSKASVVMGWVKSGHPDLVKYFCSLESTGLSLMKMDSDMASHVIHCFVSDEKPILPIHDSCLVRRSDKSSLIEAMVEAVKVITGREDIKVPLEATWWDARLGLQSEKFIK